MKYLAENRIMHGDLSARNVLVGNHPLKGGGLLAKVSDFGLSKNFYDNITYQKESRMLVPWKWMAIEYLTEDYFTLSSDVWSYGILLWEIMSFGQEPYGQREYDEVLDKLISGYRLPFPSIMENVLNSSLELLYDEISNISFVFDPKKRGTFSDILEIIEQYLSSTEITSYSEMFEYYQNKCAKSYLKIGNVKNASNL